MVDSFDLNDFYLWSKKSKSKLPWDRAYLNYNFLNHEIARTKIVSKWKTEFKSAKENKELDEISLYVIPCKLSSSISASINSNVNNQKIIGLSLFQNTPSILLIAIIPESCKIPYDFKLINIRSKKRVVINEVTKKPLEFIEINDWNYIRSDSIYVDVPFEKKRITKLINSSISSDNQNLALGFTQSIVGAPKVINDAGGISFTSFTNSSSFSKEIFKTIQLMLPPEYRCIKPPLRVEKGSWFNYGNGIQFHLAEKPYSDSNYLKGSIFKTVNSMSSELNQRIKYSGEYSSVSSIFCSDNTLSHEFKTLLLNFSKVEFTIPEDLSTCQFDTDLLRIKREIDSDLWMQVVNYRYVNPSIKNDSIKLNLLRKLREDFDSILSDSFKNFEQRDSILESIMKGIQNNVLRLSQSFARYDNTDKVNKNHFVKVRDVLVDNLNDFLNSGYVKSQANIFNKIKINEVYSLIETSLVSCQHQTINQIYESVKDSDLIRDFYHFQSIVDELIEKNWILRHNNGTYYWIGPFR